MRIWRRSRYRTSYEKGLVGWICCIDPVGNRRFGDEGTDVIGIDWLWRRKQSGNPIVSSLLYVSRFFVAPEFSATTCGATSMLKQTMGDSCEVRGLSYEKHVWKPMA